MPFSVALSGKSLMLKEMEMMWHIVLPFLLNLLIIMHVGLEEAPGWLLPLLHTDVPSLY